jgi:hypothetical protein
MHGVLDNCEPLVPGVPDCVPSPADATSCCPSRRGDRERVWHEFREVQRAWDVVVGDRWSADLPGQPVFRIRLQGGGSRTVVRMQAPGKSPGSSSAEQSRVCQTIWSCG